MSAPAAKYSSPPAITPFRYLIVYPMVLDTLGRKWRESVPAADPATPVSAR